MKLKQVPPYLFRLFGGLILVGVFFLTVLWYTIVGSVVIGYIDLKERIKKWRTKK